MYRIKQFSSHVRRVWNGYEI